MDSGPVYSGFSFEFHSILDPRSAFPEAQYGICGVLRSALHRPYMPNASVCWVDFDIIMQQNKMQVQNSNNRVRS
jgi:hypothetical protein